MTEPPSGSLPRPDLPGPGLPAPALPGPELDADGERLASLLADLADDPDAPPSTVTAESVLAAVRAQALSADAAAPVSGADVASRTEGSAGSRSDGEVSDGEVSGGGASGGGLSDGGASGGGVVDGRKRFQARRALLVGVLAAACLAAVAAVVVPLSLRSSETVTSAESALDTAADSNAEAGQAGEAPRQSAADQSAADLSAAGSSAAQAPEAAGGQADAALPSAPAPAEAGGSAAGSPVCTWSPLSADAAAALTQSLPPGRFGAPGELIAACAAAPVAGALLPDSTGGSLVITVSNAKPGACSSGSSNLDVTETGIRCVSQGSGRYLSTDAGGGQTAYTYANGLEVAVGKNRSGTGLPEGSPLTADQVLAAAEAVLGTLG